MCSARDNAALPALGFPIRASAGHWLFSASPRLIAAVHALHRLLVPRHPPYALTILTVIGESLRDSLKRNLTVSPGVSQGDSHSEKSTWISPKGNRRAGDYPYPCHWLLCSFQGPRRGLRTTWKPGTWSSEPPAVRRSLKTQQHAVKSASAGSIDRNLPDRIGVSTAASRFLSTESPSGGSAGSVDVSSA